MTDLESLLRNTRPAPIAAGPHRDRLERLLLEHRPEPPCAPWPLRRYALALWAAVLCLGLSILLQPRVPALRLGAEQREILTALLPAGPAPAIRPAAAPTPAPPRALTPPPAHPRRNTTPTTLNDQTTLNDILADMTRK